MLKSPSWLKLATKKENRSSPFLILNYFWLVNNNQFFAGVQAWIVWAVRNDEVNDFVAELVNYTENTAGKQFSFIKDAFEEGNKACTEAFQAFTGVKS